MKKLLFIIVVLLGILVPSMLGYVKKSKAASARYESYVADQEEHELFQF